VAFGHRDKSVKNKVIFGGIVLPLKIKKIIILFSATFF
jgi:hypothetical protein